MKKLILILFALSMTACTSSPQNHTEVNWTQSNLAALSNLSIQLKSNLWTDQMPTVGDEKGSNNLNGTLTLDASGELAADLVVNMVVIKQGEKTWFIGGEDTELRTQSENRWEVVFRSDIELDLEKTVNVALELSDNAGKAWLVEQNVAIDKVY